MKAQKKGPPLGIGGPRRRVSIAGVVFTPARGVIHPSFPLRGRWERTEKSDKQAPSPSLVSLYSPSYETRPRARDNARLRPLSCDGQPSLSGFLSLGYEPMGDLGLHQIRTANSFRNRLQTESGMKQFVDLPMGFSRASSRTLVTKISNSRGYRFFDANLQKWWHESDGATHLLRSSVPPETPRFWSGAARLRRDAFCRYAIHVATYAGHWMLLPLRRSEAAQRLREDVRFKTVRFALVGGDLPEATHAIASSRF